MSRLLRVSWGVLDAVRAPALPAQPCSRGRFGRGAKPPSEWESGVPQDYVYAVALGVLLLFVWSQF